MVYTHKSRRTRRRFRRKSYLKGHLSKLTYLPFEEAAKLGARRYPQSPQIDLRGILNNDERQKEKIRQEGDHAIAKVTPKEMGDRRQGGVKKPRELPPHDPALDKRINQRKNSTISRLGREMPQPDWERSRNWSNLERSLSRGIRRAKPQTAVRESRKGGKNRLRMSLSDTNFLGGDAETYWREQGELEYFAITRKLILKHAVNRNSILGIGIGMLPFIEEMPFTKRVVIDLKRDILTHPRETDAIIKFSDPDLSNIKPRSFDVVVCLHDMNATLEPKALWSIAKELIVVSYPFLWSTGTERGLDYEWLNRRMGTAPKIHRITKNAPQRAIGVFQP